MAYLPVNQAAAPPHDEPTAFSDVLFSPSIPARTSVDDELDNGDIYRGGAPPLRSPTFRSVVSSSSSSSSSTSSSSSSSEGGRLGAITGVLERAISRWARANASTSSLSSTTSLSSTVSTIRTLTRTSIVARPRRRRRQSSVASLHNAQSEREIYARIRAREESRQIPRELTLYLPPALRGPAIQGHRHRGHKNTVEPIPEGDEEGMEEDCVLRSVSLPVVLAKLDTAMKKSAKARRLLDRSRTSNGAQRPGTNLTSRLAAVVAPPLLRRTHHSSSQPGSANAIRTMRKSRKGKEREHPPTETAQLHYSYQMVQYHASLIPSLNTTPTGSRAPKRPPVRPPVDPEPDAAWWLDIASPTYDDLRNIGQLLHLHPLTLEDILQQERREKLEHFPALGYYFIVFRAIESRTARDRLQRLLNPNRDCDKNTNLDDEGIIGEVLVYLVVFKEGICSFHFADIKEHTDRVRSRAMMFEKTRVTSADWLAHGLLDSIVDSFFPFLEEIEKEVMVIENMAFSEDPVNAAPPPPPPMRDPDEKPAQNSPGSFTVGDSLKTSLPKDLSPPPERPPEEKPHVIFTGPSTGAKDQRATVRLPLLPMRLALRRLRRRMRKFARRAILKVFPWFDPQRPTKSCISAGEGTGAGAALRRMARTRRLVTNLTRLLATKADVVSRMQKRLLSQAHGDPAGLAGGGLSGTNAGVTGAPNRHGLADILEGREPASLGDGARSRGAAKIAIYYGDVQDHIFTLHDSLTHYERMLSQSHPTYLTQLRNVGNRANSRMDKAIFILTCVIVGVYLIQPTIGLLSMNANVPHNTRGGSKHWYWALVILVCVIEICVYVMAIRWLWRGARRRHLLL